MQVAQALDHVGLVLVLEHDHGAGGASQRHDRRGVDDAAPQRQVLVAAHVAFVVVQVHVLEVVACRRSATRRACP